ncbi:TPA: helix-turn-helix domain-containing protein [Pseudomonas aeruginosa]|uniref:Helix-turn-helix domain-containing protein n=3 Tax=Pseudomonas aeruginosa group TaxID=136841 RepID=A0ABD7K4I3_PSEAI|nr:MULTISPECIES: RodZ family helix-turn-helix domain-containing protein [Pseudomonas aeruginosa group]RTS01209.1 helix-turn-helix domain-containing protein [Pseudomonas paraeruginosa]RTS47940.1 helix-turn-helix domain-containing protein [Pseudomonas aeruginosa]HBN8231825.1 helix-turn-helix domain-containing protein [Pseudomonas aeruginosa]HBP6460163.1 helix-turn-helix domain-containing protein [Pseudomonas aeruginosa]HBP6818958.1 helix-turn-helix domain-containing protein [Pseudomonas aerugino
MMKAPQPEVVATASRQNPGETLRQAREQKGLSLSQVAGQLNLTENSLRQLENGAFDKLPGHTFSRGYIRAYAKLMGLDQAELVNSFDHFTGTNASGSTVQSLGRVAEPVRLSRNVLRIVSLLLLALLIGFGYFWWQEHSARNPETAGLSLEHVEVESADGTTEIHTLDEPEDQAVAEAQKEGGQPPVEVSPEIAAQAEGTPPAATEGGQVPAAPAQQGSVAAPQQPATAPAAPAASAPGAAPGAPLTASPAAPAAPGEPAVAPVVAGEGQGVVKVQFVADCWTQVTDANGKVLVSALKRKGDSLELAGKAPLELRLGFARGAQVSYNGQPVDVTPFVRGETARLKVGQ